MSLERKVKKTCLLMLSLLFFLFGGLSFQALARENVNYWYIKDFKSSIEIFNDDSAIITEDIIADCGSAQGKHGIFRIVPTRSNTPDGPIYTSVELISITDFENNPYKYSTTVNAGTITWKIGSPNITVSGENNYRIKYRVNNVIRDQEGFDEFYWNLSGNHWDLEIDNFKAEIILPQEINQTNNEIYLYDGISNSKDNTISSYSWIEENVLTVESKKTLNINQGITLSLSFPKGYINHQQIEERNLSSKNVLTFITQTDLIMPLLTIFYLIFSPLLVFIIAFILYKRKQRQNPYYKKSLVTEYNPPENISPIMLGFIDKQNVKANFITASIVRMAVLKLIKIEEKEKTLVFLKNKYLEFIKTETQENYNQLDEIEKYIFDLLFQDNNKINSNQLKQKFTNILPKITKKIKQVAKQKDYLSTETNTLKRNYLIFAVVFMLTGNLFTFLILIAFHITTKNLGKRGQEIYWRIQGFKQYMNIAEKERHNFYEKENIFTKLLPYSIAIGDVKKWIKKMADIYGEDYIANSFYWYAGASGLSSLNKIDAITSSISSISSNINSSMGSSSGGGGGGFSGGGGGGGGGGGW